MFSPLTFVQILAHTFCECEQSGSSIMEQNSVSISLNNVLCGSDGPVNLEGVEAYTSGLGETATEKFLFEPSSGNTCL